MKMWDNSEALRGLSHGLMWASATLAVLAAVATGVRYYVDRRVGELSAAARLVEQKSRDLAEAGREAKLQEELRAADLRLQESERLARSAEQTADELRKGAAPRRLSPSQGEAILAAIKQYAGQSCTVVFVNGAPDAEGFARDFADILEQAAWKRSGDVDSNNFSKDPIGVQVTLNIAYMEKRLAPPAGATALAAVLVEVGLAPDAQLFVNPGTPMGVVEVRIGHRPVRPR